MALLALLSYRLLYRPQPKEADPDAIRPFILLMGSFVLWFLAALVFLSVISAIVSWLYFLWLRRKGKSAFDISFQIDQQKNGKRKLFLEALLPGVFRPVLGFVKGRLLYDDNQMTEKFALLSSRRKKNSLLRDAITGRSRVGLPDIREYTIKGGFVYFEDLLQLISLPVPQRIAGHFYQPPTALDRETATAAPKKTDTMDIRIDQLRKVEGEHLNYKSFESGDDVRRIVWKVYAKNRDLVVRIPERLEPYASHLYFYASFHDGLQTMVAGNDYMSELLNFYKNNVWGIYEALLRQEWQIRYIPDQQFTTGEELSEKERNELIISNSLWQQHTPVQDYFKPKTGSVLVISSLTDPKALAALLDECDNSVQIYYIKLSLAFRQLVPLGWLSRVLFLPPKERLSRLKSNWLFTPLRRQLLKREKELERLVG